MKSIYKKILTAVAIIIALFMAGATLYASAIPQAPALFDTSMAFPQATTDTTFTLVANTLTSGASISGYTCFTIDSGLPNSEYECGNVSGLNVTGVTRGIDPVTGNTSDSQLIFSHRRGADVRITTFPILTLLRNIFAGTGTIDNILSYTSNPSFTTSTQIPDKAYIDNSIIAGGVPATTTSLGIGEVSTAPVNPLTPIFVGTNDLRVPTLGEAAALSGSAGTPSATNTYITEANTAATSTPNAVIKANGSGLIDPSFLTAVPSENITLSAAESIATGTPVTGYYYQSDGGIKFDTATSTSGTVSSGTSFTKAMTIGNNSNRVLVVFLSSNTSGGSTPTVTYDGVSMTQVDIKQVSTKTVQSFELFAPATGNNNIVVTLGSSATYTYSMSAYSYYQVSQSGIDSHAQAGSGSSITSISDTIANSGALAITYIDSGSASPSLTTNAANNQITIAASPNDAESGDSGQVYLTGSMTVTFTSTANYAFVVALAPVTPVSTGYCANADSANMPNPANLNRYQAFLGFATNAATTGQSVSIQTTGVNTNQTGLIPNEQYYLNNSAGTIGTSAGTNTRKVGIALTTTSLLITNIW